MEYNFLGSSDLKVSEIGFGAMSLDVKNTTISSDLIRFAYDQGINYFDTADLYDKGSNESLVGAAVRSFRKDIVLATKGGNKWRADGTGWDWDVSPLYIQKAVDDSLKRLGTDYIDLYQIHGGTIQDSFEDVVATLEKLVDAGKIRCYGISSIRPNVFLKYSEHANIVSNMMQFSLLDSRPQAYLPIFEQQKVSVIARGVLAQGLLVGKNAKAYLDYSVDEIVEIQNLLQAFSKKYGVSELAIALSAVLSENSVASALVGVRNQQQLNDILDAYNTIIGSSCLLDKTGIRPIAYKEHIV